MKQASSGIFDVTELPSELIFVMYQMFSKYYDATSLAIFKRDLYLKDKILLLGNMSGENYKSFQPLDFIERLIGFSSLSERNIVLDDKRLKIFFNGDTIIDPRYWGSNAMARTWARYFFRKKSEEPHLFFYWFLICSGHRTYRLLPSFFKNYYPGYAVEKGEVHELKRLLDRVAVEFFGNVYDPDTNLIYLDHPTPLKNELLEISELKKLKSEIRYFTDLNQEHDKGIELACITEISESNLTAAGRKLITYDM